MKHFAPLSIGLFVLLFLFTNMGTGGVCSAIDVQVSNNNAKAGDTITVTGTTTPGDWASLRAIDQNGSILYFNAVKADNTGHYTDTFKAPENCTGTLQITAGQGNDSAAASVVVTNPSSPVSNTPGDSGGSSSSPSAGNQGSKPSGEITEEISEKLPFPQPMPELVPPGDIAGHWARENIIKLIEAGVIAGYPDGTFRPNQTISRGELTVMLVRALKLEAKPGNSYADTASHWAKDSIATATANGLVAGLGQNTFGPENPVTREQAAVIISRTAKPGYSAVTLKFSDYNQISPWAQPGIAAAVKAGFMTGYPDGTLQPKKNITRAEAAVILVKLLP